ncbi:WD40-repeat-containing domain protein [Suillus discolor]|uniref:WD40-repeat-containing domain protein n=1 Tax=Suillus discolor TaxID=1912936 RepID=A0A9P7EV42_9AGAM|nr:WD40-repeat-containing domain protein [Suillus discolor]KAG2092507.1 WD40-repeat-containing domain protein [Suillus discolor]
MERPRFRRSRRMRNAEDQPRRTAVPPRARPTPTHPKETNVIRLPEGSGLGRFTLDVGGPLDAVTSVCWSRSGEQMFSGSRDGTIRVWSSGTGAQVALLQGHTNTVHAIAISFDGRFIASASSDCTVRLWSVRTYEAVSPPFEHADELYCVTFSPDRKRVACGGKDTKVYLWDIEPYTKPDASIMDSCEPAPELPLAPSDEDILNELLIQEVAGFLPPLALQNGVPPDLNVPSAFTENWPSNEINNALEDASKDSNQPKESIEILPSPVPSSSSSKHRFLDRLPLFRRRNDVDNCSAANSVLAKG